MIIGIEAVNLYLGGGMTHILNILSHFKPEKHNIEKIVIWARQDVLDQIENYSWIEKRTNTDINGGLVSRYKFLLFRSKSEFSAHCDILFTPSGLYIGFFKPFVSMSRNMLLFDKKERDRLDTKNRYKILLSKIFQIISFKKASGIIFISKYAQSFITKELSLNESKCTIIHHGISDKFRVDPREKIRKTDIDKPIEILYTSHVYAYKHPWNVVEAVKILVDKGYRLKLNLVGGGDEVSVSRLNQMIYSCDPDGVFVKYHGHQPYESMNELYKNTDVFVFASTCENMPNILIEAMSAGLPIACSNSNPMPEFLMDAGVYFDAEIVSEIADAIETLLLSPELCSELGAKASEYASQYSWVKTAEKTFNFIESIYN